MKRKQLLLSSIFGLAITCGISGQSNADTLEEVLSLTYSTNPQIEQARFVLRQTDENVPIAFSNWMPQVIVNTQAQYTEQRFEDGVNLNLNGPANTGNTTFTGTVTVDQNIYRGGRTFYETAKAKEQVMQQRAALKNTEQDVLLASVQAFLEVYQNEKILALRIESEDILRTQLKAARDRFEVGEITRTDVAQAESRLAQAEANTALARALLQGSRADYFQQIGKYPENLERPNIMIELPNNLEEALARAEASNPDIMAAGSAYQVTVEDVNIVEGLMLPEVTFQAQAQRQYNENLGLADAPDPDFVDTYTLTLNANIPLYQRGLRFAQLRQAKQAVGAARYALYTTYRDVAQQVKEIWSNFKAANEQIRAFRSQVKAAEIAFEGASQEAFLGAKSTLDVLNLQDDLINAKINLVQSEQQRDLFAYQLFNVIGLLTAQDLNLPVDYYDYTVHYEEVRNKVIGFGESHDEHKPYTEEYLR